MSDTPTASWAFGPWQAEYAAEDGGRICRLRFAGADLLTAPPARFRPPAADYGRYETRPVYGYDDCFPSVDPCPYPDGEGEVPDHGELCWMPWTVGAERTALFFTVDSRRLKAGFRRSMRFGHASLLWEFSVSNHGSRPLPAQHVMHALMPLREVAELWLPRFTELVDERGGRRRSAQGLFLEHELLARPRGAVAMLLLRGLAEGRFALRFRSGLTLRAQFPHRLFPTLGVWWNNGGYPDENGRRRIECAFEPIPGGSSRLSDAWQDRTCLFVPPRRSLSWTIRWELEQTDAVPRRPKRQPVRRGGEPGRGPAR